jgi:hypothetical protein
VNAEPSVDLRRLDLIRHSLTEGFKNVLHPALKISNILAIVIDVPVNRFLCDDLKPNPFVLHVVR